MKMHLLATLFLASGLAFAQEAPPALEPAPPAEQASEHYDEFPGFTAAERQGLSEAQIKVIIEVANSMTCPCGCSFGSIATCAHKDPNCPVSPKLIARVVELVRQNPQMTAQEAKERLESDFQAQQEARRKAMEEAKKAEQARQTQIFQVPLGDSPWKGAQNAKVTIVEFSEFKCPFCGQLNGTLKKLVEAYPDQVKVVFKHFLVHQSAVPAAMAAYEAHAHGKFWEMNDRLFGDMMGQSPENFERWAAEIGVDGEAIRQAVESNKYLSILQRDQQLGQELGIHATPTMFINGRLAQGAIPFEQFQRIVEAESARAQKLLDQGIAPEKLYEELTKPQAAPAQPTPQ